MTSTCDLRWIHGPIGLAATEDPDRGFSADRPDYCAGQKWICRRPIRWSTLERGRTRRLRRGKMRGWDFSVPIDPQAGVPLFAQISRIIAADIGRGRLRPGDVMPGTRTLARTIGVNRNTVIAAYDDLAAEGWITTENGRGTFVSRVLPDPRPRRFAAAADPDGSGDSDAFELGAGVAVDVCPSGLAATYNLAGWPDLRLVPTQALARAWRRSIERRGRHVLSYGPAGGHPRLR